MRIPGRPRASGAPLALATRGFPGLAAAVHLVAPRGDLPNQRRARDVPAAAQFRGRARGERVVLVVGRSGRALAEPSLAAQTGRRVPVRWVARPPPFARWRGADRATLQALHARARGVKFSSLQVHPPAGGVRGLLQHLEGVVVPRHLVNLGTARKSRETRAGGHGLAAVALASREKRTSRLGCIARA